MKTFLIIIAFLTGFNCQAQSITSDMIKEADSLWKDYSKTMITEDFKMVNVESQNELSNLSLTEGYRLLSFDFESYEPGKSKVSTLLIDLNRGIFFLRKRASSEINALVVISFSANKSSLSQIQEPVLAKEIQTAVLIARASDVFKNSTLFILELKSLNLSLIAFKGIDDVLYLSPVINNERFNIKVGNVILAENVFPLIHTYIKSHPEFIN